MSAFVAAATGDSSARRLKVKVLGVKVVVVGDTAPDSAPVGVQPFVANEKPVPSVNVVALGVVQTKKVAVGSGAVPLTSRKPTDVKASVAPGARPCAAVVAIVAPATAATPIATPTLATVKVAVAAAGAAAPPIRRLHVPEHANPNGCPTARLCTPLVESVATPAAPAATPASAV